MTLDRVTITGADDSVSVQDLAGLTRDWPFVEWGILVSRRQEGTFRYPSEPWLRQLVELAPAHGLRLSLHVCGQWVRDFVQGQPTLAEERPWLWGAFPRVQLNFHAEPHHRTSLFAGAMRGYGRGKQFIFQIDGVNDELFRYARFQHDDIDAVPLFDTSGGAGVVPEHWPSPMLDVEYQGYAGGLGPENVNKELPRIAQVADGQRIWIDMERQVRSDDDSRLNLARCLNVLRRCAPYVQPATLSVAPPVGA